MSIPDRFLSSAMMVRFKNLKSLGIGKGHCKRKSILKGWIDIVTIMMLMIIQGIPVLNCTCLQIGIKISNKKSKPTSKAIINLADTPFDKQQDSEKVKEETLWLG